MHWPIRCEVAIARVKVEIDPAQPKEQLRVRYSGSVTIPKQQTKFANGVVTLSPQGEVINSDRQNDYSLVSTTTSGLPFDLLPRAGQRQWNTSRQYQVVYTETDNNDSGFPFGGPHFGPPAFNRFGPRFGPRGGLMPGQEPNGKRVNVEDQLTYDLDELTDDKAVVNTTYVSSRTEQQSGKLLGKVVGAGQYTFDRKQGVMTSGLMEMKLKVDSEGVEVKVPMTIAFKLREALTSDQIKEARKKQNWKPPIAMPSIRPRSVSN